MREVLAPYDTVLVVGAPAFRQTAYMPGSFTAPGTRIALVADDAEEVYRSPAHLAAVGSPASICAQLAARLEQRDAEPPALHLRPEAPPPPAPGERLTASHVLAELAARLPREAIVLEEAPVDRPDIHDRLPAREPLGYLSAAQGGLGFALPAAAGLRMALPDRPVVAITGDGAAIYQIQSVWSAQRYGCGALYVILANGGYTIMDRLAEKAGGAGPWPGFEEIQLSAIARSFGCPAERIETHDQLVSTLDEVVPGLAGRTEPLLLDCVIEPTGSFKP